MTGKEKKEYLNGLPNPHLSSIILCRSIMGRAESKSAKREVSRFICIMQDLFTKPLSKKDQLYNWIKSKGRCKTSDIMRWGLDNFHIRSDRDCRELASEGRIWRMNKFTKTAAYPKTKEDVWSVYESDK
jgi:glutamine cyclotransferase